MHEQDKSEAGNIDIEHLVHAIALARRTVLAWLTAFAVIIVIIGLVGISNWVSN